MAKAHPAKKARFLAGCMGAAGFALTSVAVLEDSLVEYEISSAFLQDRQSESQPVGINSEAFALQGSATPAPAAPQTSEPEVSVEAQPLTEDTTQTTAKQKEQPKEKVEVAEESDTESDAS